MKTLEEHGAMEYTVVVSASASDAGLAPVHSPVHGLHHRRVLQGQRQARAHRIRRPLQAGRRIQAALAAAQAPAWTRGVPGRRLLSAFAPSRARREALRRSGRRLPYGAPDNRDPGGRRLGVHPDKRYLDYGRSDIPRGGTVLLRHSPRAQRRPLGFPRRRLGADKGDEAGRRLPEA